MAPSDVATRFEPHVRWREWSNLRAGLAWIYEGPVPADARRGRYSPDYLGAWLIQRGRGLLRHDEKTVVAQAGEWLIPWPGQRYQEFSDDAEILSVRFRAVWPDGRPLFDRGLSVRFAARDHADLGRISRALLEAAQRVMPAEPRQLAQAPVGFAEFVEVNRAFLAWLGCFYDTLLTVGVKPSRLGIHDERIVAALQTLDSVGVSERLRETRLAAEAGLGVSQFVRLFRQELGETPKQYFEQRRRAYAREMITSTAVPIKEIALSLGFTRLSDFSAWFKQHLGKPPREIREEARHDSPV